MSQEHAVREIECEDVERGCLLLETCPEDRRAQEQGTDDDHALALLEGDLCEDENIVEEERDHDRAKPFGKHRERDRDDAREHEGHE